MSRRDFTEIHLDQIDEIIETHKDKYSVVVGPSQPHNFILRVYPAGDKFKPSKVIVHDKFSDINEVDKHVRNALLSAILSEQNIRIRGFRN